MWSPPPTCSSEWTIEVRSRRTISYGATGPPGIASRRAQPSAGPLLWLLALEIAPTVHGKVDDHVVKVSIVVHYQEPSVWRPRSLAHDQLAFRCSFSNAKKVICVCPTRSSKSRNLRIA